MRLRNLAVLSGIVLLASACTDSRLVEDVSQLKPKEAGFKANLHKEYVALAKPERDEGDIYDTGVFARRAEASAKGKGVAPDKLWDRSFTKKNTAVIYDERGRLVAALDGGGRSGHPVIAARAQAMFDCWAQELEENNQPPDIERCRSAYMTAMDQLAAAMKPKPKPPAPKVAAKPKPKKPAKKKAKPMTFKMPFVVYFDFDSTNIADMNSAKVITEAARAAISGKSTRVEVIGHTDTSGSAAYNQKLSEARAKMVDDALVALGVNQLVVERHANGESNLEVQTDDGVRKDANRRVVIVVH